MRAALGSEVLKMKTPFQRQREMKRPVANAQGMTCVQALIGEP
jgi:hypothetical protein